MTRPVRVVGLAWWRRAIVALLFAGCAGRGVTHGVSGVATAGCPVYTDVPSIAALRTELDSQCVTVHDVLVVERTDSATAPRLFLQQDQGGPYSAIMAKCDPADAKYPCSAAALAATFHLLRGEAVSISGRYHRGRVSGFEELSIEGLVDHGAQRAIPAPLVLGSADLARDAARTALWFQRVSVTVSPDDPWVIYDLSPPELQSTTAACPLWSGFAVIPASAQPAPSPGCLGANNPAAQPGSDPRQILVGRAFFRQFTYDGDCACTTPPKVLVLPTNQIVGTVAGVLTYEVRRGGVVGFQELLPTSKKEFPLF